MNEHSDGIAAFAKSMRHISRFASGDFSGELRFWDLNTKKSLFVVQAHDKFVKGIAFDRTGHNILSCGDDSAINIFNVRKALEQQMAGQAIEPVNRFNSGNLLTSIDCSLQDPYFVTGGDTVQIWNQERSSPFQNCDWGIDTVSKVKFNPVDTNLIACTSMDRGVYIYDIRGKAGLKKTIMLNKASCLAWNPQEPINFTVGNEDSNAYTYDMRKLEEIKIVHKDHIGAILDIDYSPTGSHFVTGSFDKTVRIFPHNKGFSSQMYYTRRMQK